MQANSCNELNMNIVESRKTLLLFSLGIGLSIGLLTTTTALVHGCQ